MRPSYLISLFVTLWLIGVPVKACEKNIIFSGISRFTNVVNGEEIRKNTRTTIEVSEEQFEASPKWQAGTGIEPALQPNKAVQLALPLAMEQYKGTERVKVYRIVLRQHICVENWWYYLISFTPNSYPLNRAPSFSNYVAVLLDGTVIQSQSKPESTKMTPPKKKTEDIF